jgi:SAM-dependent methyltransferase
MASTEQSTFYDRHPFDWVAPSQGADIRSVVSPLLAELIERLDANSFVLDVGCGPGRVLGFLARRKLRCVGIDRSYVSVGRAVKYYGRPAVVADNLRLPVPDAIADVIISDGVIHHTEDPYRAFTENLRILKPGGQMYLGVYKPFGRYPRLYKFPGQQIRTGLRLSWTKPIVLLFAQVPYFVLHFVRSRGQRTWSGAQNLFYDYFVTPRVTFLSREMIESWCSEHGAHVLLYDENDGGNVHSFVVRKQSATETGAGSENGAHSNLSEVHGMGSKMRNRNIHSPITEVSSIERDFREPTTFTSDASSLVTLSRPRDHWVYQSAWYGANALLAVSVLFVLYTLVWEYSTQRYLKGFSDAVVPALATPEEKITAILAWMGHGPARLPALPSGVTQDRDPTDTLNYQALLQVCGSATNAFINLADSSGLSARRLLLLNNNHGAKHVVAEVLVNGKWIVVDPSFRTILRGPSGQFLTRNDLANPTVFWVATHNIPHYDPSYDYTETVHVRLTRIPFLGEALHRTLNRYLPDWSDSPAISLLIERESLAAVVASLLAVLFLVLLRISVRWYGESRLGFQAIRVRTKCRRAARAFLSRAT